MPLSLRRCASAESRLGGGGRLRFAALDPQPRAPFVALGANTGSLYLFSLVLPAAAGAEKEEEEEALRFSQVCSLRELREGIAALHSAPRPLNAAEEKLSGSSLLLSNNNTSVAAAASSSSSSVGASSGLSKTYICGAATALNRLFFVELALQFDVQDEQHVQQQQQQHRQQFLLRPPVGTPAHRVLARFQHDCAITSLLWLEATVPGSPSVIDTDRPLTCFFGDERGRVFVVEDVARLRAQPQASRLAATAKLKSSSVASFDAEQLCVVVAADVNMQDVDASSSGTPVVQLAQMGRHLVVSTHAGALVVDLASWDRARQQLAAEKLRPQASSSPIGLTASARSGAKSAATSAIRQQHQYAYRIGSKPRDVPAGVCFAPAALRIPVGDDGETELGVLSARPAKRMWLANPLDGSVTQTFNFSNLAKIAPVPGDGSQTSNDYKRAARKFMFTQLHSLDSTTVLGICSARQFSNAAEHADNAVGAAVVMDAINASVKEWTLSHTGVADLRLFSPAQLTNERSILGYIALAPEPYHAVWSVVVRQAASEQLRADDSVLDETNFKSSPQIDLALASTTSADDSAFDLAAGGDPALEGTSAVRIPLTPTGMAESLVVQDDLSHNAEPTTDNSSRDAALTSDDSEHLSIESVNSDGTVVVENNESAFSAATSQDEKISALKVVENSIVASSDAEPTSRASALPEIGDSSLVHSVSSVDSVHAIAPTEATILRRKKHRRKGSQNVVDIAGPSSRPLLTRKQRESTSSISSVVKPDPPLVPESPSNGVDFLQRAGLSVVLSQTPIVSADNTPEPAIKPASALPTSTSTSAATLSRNENSASLTEAGHDTEVEVMTIVNATSARVPATVGSESESEPVKGVYTLLIEEQERARAQALIQAQKSRQLAQESTLEHKVGRSMEAMQKLSATALNRTKSSQAKAGSLMNAITAKSKSAFSEIVSDFTQDFAAEFIDDSRIGSEFDMSGVASSLDRTFRPAAPALSATGNLAVDNATNAKPSPAAALRVLEQRTRWIHQVCLCYNQEQASAASVVSAVTLGSPQQAGEMSHWLTLLEHVFELHGIEPTLADDGSESTVPQFLGPSATSIVAAIGAPSSSLSTQICGCLSTFFECATGMLFRASESDAELLPGFRLAADVETFALRWSAWLKPEKVIKKLLSTCFPPRLFFKILSAGDQALAETIAEKTSLQARVAFAGLIRNGARDAIMRDPSIVAKLGPAAASLNPNRRTDDVEPSTPDNAEGALDRNLSSLKSAHNLCLALFILPELIAQQASEAVLRRICKYVVDEWRTSSTSAFSASILLLILRGGLHFSNRDSANGPTIVCYTNIFAECYLDPALQQHAQSSAVGYPDGFAELVVSSLIWAFISADCTIVRKGTAVRILDSYATLNVARSTVLLFCEKCLASNIRHPKVIEEFVKFTVEHVRTFPSLERLCYAAQQCVYSNAEDVECKCLIMDKSILDLVRTGALYADLLRQGDEAPCPVLSLWQALFQAISSHHESARCVSKFDLPDSLRKEMLSCLSTSELFALAEMFGEFVIGPSGIVSWLLPGVISDITVKHERSRGVHGLLEAVDSYSWKGKPTAAPPQLVSLIRQQMAATAQPLCARVASELQRANVGSELSTAEVARRALVVAGEADVVQKPVGSLPAGEELQLRPFADKQLHWGAAAILGASNGSCNLCTLALFENIGNISSVCVFPCGHAFHQHCFSSAASTNKITPPRMLGSASPSMVPASDGGIPVACLWCANSRTATHEQTIEP